MSRNWVPALVAIGVGVFTGYHTFQPAFKELQDERLKSTQSPAQSQEQKTAQPSTPTSNGDSPKPAA
ncbi:hypothetical protein BO71DRAFT_394055 [Aspergillus ellipticus CBS 707.79]|uniref:Uncharacterized protein n=1 Tax=Aspergillus ellipticus CBS 707.79 TaxID=1448320 RepID=A0A319DPJ3_9EURO|nr:hypothetical protein BO71DRAFT_394055 [Aspergillus ellipticus CBS 707.79]